MVDEAETWRGVAIDDEPVAVKLWVLTLRECLKSCLEVKYQEDGERFGKCPTSSRGPMAIGKATMVPIKSCRPLSLLWSPSSSHSDLVPVADDNDFVGLVMADFSSTNHNLTRMLVKVLSSRVR